MIGRITSAICKILITFSWAILIIVVAGTYLPHNPFTPPGKSKFYIIALFPEGWGFFTKNAQDPDVFVYSRRDKEWISLLRTPNSSFQNLFGLQRNARSQGTEYGILLDIARKDSLTWTTCKSLSMVDCFNKNQALEFVEMTNPVKNPTLCGEVWIAVQNPIPWAWNESSPQMPIQFVKLKIKCNASSNN